MIQSAFVFPGQGSQFVGMGKELCEVFSEAKEVFQEVDDTLSEKLSDIIFNGPEETLTLTQHTQPALMAVSIAILRVLKKQGGVCLDSLCSKVAGHSLGEYSALCAAGSISLADTARLLRIRGNAMQEAVPEGEGAMAALIGIEFDAAEAMVNQIAKSDVCQAANDNGGGQVVISGSAAAIDRAIDAAEDYGVRRAVKLPVSAPFHSALMEPAAKVMEHALAETDVQSPIVPVVANVTAKDVTSPGEIRKLLVQQVTGVVRWRESVESMKEDSITTFVEIGAGKVLSGLVKRIDRNLRVISIQDPVGIEAFLHEEL